MNKTDPRIVLDAVDRKLLYLPVLSVGQLAEAYRRRERYWHEDDSSLVERLRASTH